MLYPGFEKSERFGSRFRVGPGFDITLRHNLFRLSPSVIVDSRYSIRNYYCDVNLSDEDARFTFSYMSIDLTLPLKQISRWQLYGGAGLSLNLLSGHRRYFNEDVTDVVLMPELITGIEYKFGEDFNLYLETMLQYGFLSVDSDKDFIPIHGIKIALGGTMFVSVE